MPLAPTVRPTLGLTLALPLALSLTVSLPLPASAQSDQVSLPEGCTAYLTMQSRSCRVTHYFTCEMDPEGWQRRMDMDENGMTYLGAIDDETQWMESFHLYTGHAETLEESPEDPASLSELIETGSNVYDFQTESDEIGISRYAGEDRLTGEQVEIDGVTLDETEYDITAYDEDGNVLWSSYGNEYISRDWRMFISGTSTYMTPEDGSVESDDTPVEFIFPGESGFLSENPKYGCGEEEA